MRYEKGHKEATRKKIVEVAAAEFRREGLNGIGVADVMARAGLTHGGFYSHFSSKEELVRAALEETYEQSRLRKGGEEGKSLEELIRNYLRPEHRDHPERGCGAAALVEEIARHPGKTRAQFTSRLQKLVSHIENRLTAEKTPEERKKTALAIFATIMGSLQLARAFHDEALSNQMIEAGIEAALTLAKK